MVFEQLTETLDYPIFGIKFLDDDTFVVSGGGGEGRHGIPNGIDMFKIIKENEQNRLLPVEGYKFEKNTTDAPMSLELYNNQIFIGCNDAKSVIEINGNTDIKSFIFNEEKKIIEKDHCYNVFESKDPQSYIKRIKLNSLESDEKFSSPIITLLNSDNHSKLYVNKLSAIKEGSLIPSPKEIGEIKDLDTHVDESNNYQLVYITKSQAFTTFSKTIKEIDTKSTLNSKDYQLGKVTFITRNEVLIFGTFTKTKKLFVLTYSIPSNKIINSNLSLESNIRSINAVDHVSFSNPEHCLLALATGDLSIILYHISLKNFKFSKLEKFLKCHTFALTNLAISKSLKWVVSVSAANTIHLIELPDDSSDLIKMIPNGNLRLILLILITFLVVYFSLIFEKR